MHVFIYAPFRDKVRRLQATGKSEAKAVELAGTVDRDRAAFIKQYFNIEWPERHRFHLMINSAIGEEAVIQTILNGITMLEKQKTRPAIPPQQMSENPSLNV
jgi:cytidylate kinase